MHDQPRQQLIEIVARYGLTVIDDPRCCNGLLLDLCGEYRREINVLIMAQEERVTVDLQALQSGVPEDLLLARLTRRLVDNRAMAQDAARWPVECWAVALGGDSGSRSPEIIRILGDPQ